jgi:hypothetical protein
MLTGVSEMGYYTRPASLGHKISCFEPDNTAKEFWIERSANILDAIRQAIEHFGPECRAEHLSIGAEFIHTDCLGYDLYDRGDYTNYLLITWER